MRSAPIYSRQNGSGFSAKTGPWMFLPFIYSATHSRRKAFIWSSLSGLAEPLGAIIAALFLLPILNAAVIGYVLAAVAGIMVFISMDELVPISRSYGEEHLSILGVMAGMAVMAFSLWVMGCC